MQPRVKEFIGYNLSKMDVSNPTKSEEKSFDLKKQILIKSIHLKILNMLKMIDSNASIEISYCYRLVRKTKRKFLFSKIKFSCQK